MEHLAAYSESIDQAALGAITAVQDDVLTRSGTDRFYVPSDYRWIKWGLATGPNLTRAQLVAPSLQVKRMNTEVLPRNDGADVLSLDQPQIWVPPRPIELRGTETIEAQTAEDGAGATRQNVLIALGPQERNPMPEGDIRINRATGTTTLTAFGWTTVPLTLDDDLEPGTYELVGMYCISANAIAGRAIITGMNYRPGVPGLAGAEDVASDFDPAMFMDVMYHSMGSFTHVNVPEVQFFAGAGDTSEVVFFVTIRTGEAPGEGG